MGIVCAAVITILSVALLAGDQDDGRSSVPNSLNAGGTSANGSTDGDSDHSSGEGTATPSPQPDPLEFTEPSDDFTAAGLLPVQTECTPEQEARAVFNWTPGAPSGSAQRLDLVPDFDQFVEGQYSASSLLDGDAGSLEWRGLLPGIDYFWRVNTRLDGKWVAGQSRAFQTADCLPIDEER